MEERARLASQARYALRLYARERSRLPLRLFARFYDGLRHLYDFGSWNSDGMDWVEVKQKYTREAEHKLGPATSKDELEKYIYQRIVDKACSTNEIIDKIALQESCNSVKDRLEKLTHLQKLGASITKVIFPSSSQAKQRMQAHLAPSATLFSALLRLLPTNTL